MSQDLEQLWYLVDDHACWANGEALPVQVHNHLAQSCRDSWSIKHKYKNIPEPNGSEFWVFSSLAPFEKLTRLLSRAVKPHQPFVALRARGISEAWGRGLRSWLCWTVSWPRTGHVPGGVLTFPGIQQVLGQACRETSLSRKQNAIFGLNSVVASSKKSWILCLENKSMP